MRHAFEFHGRLQTSGGSLGETTVHRELGFRGNVFEHEIPLPRPKFAVETGRHGRKDDAVCILDVLFQKKTLVFREEVLATMSFAMNTCTRKCQIETKEWMDVGSITDGDIPWVGEFPERDGVEERCDVLVFGWMFERFWPCVHNVMDGIELVLYFLDSESFF